jgi:hypothetical protein
MNVLGGLLIAIPSAFELHFSWPSRAQFPDVVSKEKDLAVTVIRV